MKWEQDKKDFLISVFIKSKSFFIQSFSESYMKKSEKEREPREREQPIRKVIQGTFWNKLRLWIPGLSYSTLFWMKFLISLTHCLLNKTWEFFLLFKGIVKFTNLLENTISTKYGNIIISIKCTFHIRFNKYYIYVLKSKLAEIFMRQILLFCILIESLGE